MRRRLRRDIRILQIYTGLITLALVAVATASFRQTSERQRFGEIDVERINIVEKDGRTRLVLSNSERQAVAVIDGRPLLPGRKRPAGLIFFNENGDEVGGLTFEGGKDRIADGTFIFDRYKQDQTVELSYSEAGGKPRAGLRVIDRPDESIVGAVETLEAARSDAERDAARADLRARGQLGRQRMFVGRDRDGNATLTLSDANEKPRLVLSVDPAGAAKIEFRDAAGRVTRTLKD